MPILTNAVSLPVSAGIGLRAPHLDEVRAGWPKLGWVEVHSENYFMAGGPALAALESVRAHYPVSLHGVGMSLGGADALDARHLQQLKRLVARIEPAAVSEHLCWSAIGGRWLNDLLPLPYTREALQRVCDHVEQVQQVLGRQILLENVSSYLRFLPEDMPEWDFLAAVVQRTGCLLLLDVNNIHVSAVNHGFCAESFLAAMPAEAVAEIHLAGYEEDDGLLIDTHSRPVHEAVWALYRSALQRFGPRPTLIEWDQDIPPLSELLAEAARAQACLDDCREVRNVCLA
ncbi:MULTISPECIES: DUF692 domain-containing protein [unclassified Paludibacterium]|uniref:MNIO family bufferin maturase n=1 Tax=unclassified Paludibacterium TaxID=2618429 RepID=UPI001C049EEC|nr:DUF692 domain-containing protein [Paludibacterium sp. B53371]BEV72469.1 DUF692 domain-containing protein [Paludibacterium sp. THUN1379]